MTKEETAKLEPHVFSETDPEPAFYWWSEYPRLHKTLGTALASGKRKVTTFIFPKCDAGGRSQLRVTDTNVYSVKWIEEQLMTVDLSRESEDRKCLFNDYLQVQVKNGSVPASVATSFMLDTNRKGVVKNRSADQKQGNFRHMLYVNHEWVEVEKEWNETKLAVLGDRAHHPIPPPKFHFHKGDLVAYSGPRECFKGMEGVIEQDHENIAVVRWNLRHRLISKVPKGEIAIKKKAPVRRGKRQETHAWNCVRDIVLSS